MRAFATVVLIVALAGCPSSTSTQDAADEAAPNDATPNDGAADAPPVADAAPDAAPDGDASAVADAPTACSWTKMAIDISISRINAVSGTSANDLLLVGSGPWAWMVIRYDGATWHNEIQGGGAELFDIAALPGGDAVAVGASSTDSVPLIVAREGTSWTQSTLDEPGYLRAVWADATSGELFAAGWFGALFHHAGGQWQKLAAASATDVSFYDVWGTSTDNVYAVGSTASGAIFRYDGDAWSQVWQGQAPLRSIWGSSETDIYAAGGSALLHYDGTDWQPVATALGGGQALFASVWGTSAQHVVAGGSWIGAQGTLESLVLIYDGAAWTRSSIDSDLEIRALWGLSPDEMYAIGSSHTGTSTLFGYACP